jgi:hypothetical protein
MTHEIDLERLGRAAADLAEVDAGAWVEKRRIIEELTDAEQRLMAKASGAITIHELREAGAIEDPLSLLSLNLRQVERLASQGHALYWLIDQLRFSWASRPDIPLSDVLKIEPRRRIEWLARELHKVGILDLDELSPPDIMTGE